MLRTLRIRVALAFGATTLALAAGPTFVFVWRSSQTSVRDQSEHLQTLARGAATLMADGLFERLREVRWLADAPPRSAADWATAITRLQRSRTHFSWIGVADPAGRVVVATGGLLVGQSVQQRPWFVEASQRPYVGDVHPAKLLAALLPPADSGDPPRFIDFAAPVRDSAGALQYVLGVHATWDWATTVVDALKSPLARERGVELFIFDRAGRVILRPKGVASGEQPIALAALPPRGGAVEAWDDGTRYLTAAWTLPAQTPATDVGWTIVARQPLDAALAGAHRARDAGLALSVVGALLAALGAWVVAGRISAPLARIARAAKALQAGDLGVEIPLERGSREIEGLCGALRDMTSALVQREVELERRVAERTQALQQAGEALQRANAELEQLATRDALTGLLNRRAGSERLLQELARHRRSGRPLAVALLDIDHFKAVNDRHGHAAGDTVLRDVAGSLQRACRGTDIVVRWGGEEFLVLMPETAADGAAVAADKLRAAVAAHAGAVPVTLSLGVAAPVQAWRTLEAALDAADRALYAAKAGGRNRVEVAAAPQPAAARA